MNFLEKLSQHILTDYKGRLQHLTVILPNVRSRLFLSRYIQEQTSQAIFLPRFITSKELMEELAGMIAIDDFFLLTKLYNVYQKNEKEALTFETFMNWGSTLLQDLKEIDHQLVDASELFAVLTDVKQLDFWHPGDHGLSEFQLKYLNFCKNLLPIYLEFNATLRKERIGHAGLIDKTASELIKKFEFSSQSTFIVAGFNALTKAEETVFDFLEATHSLEMIFDYDQYYVDNSIHEAGFFARKNLKKYPLAVKEVTNNFNDNKEIDVFKCTTSYEQCLLLNHLLSGISNDKDLLNTAVILPEEGMLIPVLQHLPSSISKVNITMGYSLQNSPFFETIEHVFRLYINAKKNDQGEVLSFYHKDVLALLHHSVRSKAEGIHPDLESWLVKIIDQNQIFISFKEFNEYVAKSDVYCTINWHRHELIHSIIEIIQTLILSLDKDFMNTKSLMDKINREFLLHHMEVLKQVKEVTNQLDSEMDLVTVHKLWKHYTKIAKVQFTGEPLAGLQIMGLLESRTLDFEQVIVLNVNEGSLPDEKKVASLIPNDLKRKFKMNLNRERDAVIAYHFYRLLQRAKKVKLLYSNQVDSLKGGEKSRYILQLKKELIESNPAVTFKEHSTYVPFNISPIQTQQIEKSSYVLSLIRQKLKTGLSPTSLINFIKCPLNFYFLELAGLKNKEDVTEFLTQNKIGSIMHAALEALYKPYVNIVLSPENIDAMKKDLPKVLHIAHKDITGSEQITNGKNILSMSMAEKMIARLLDKEKINVKNNKVKILALETRLQKELVLNDKTTIILKGFVDRIELKNGTLHLVDYKTGNIQKNDLRVNSDENEAFLLKDKAFQLLTYAALVSNNGPYQSNEVMASVYTLKSYKDLSVQLEIDQTTIIDSSIIKEQEYRITAIATEMLDENTVFEHLETGLYCNYCQ